MTVTRFPTLPVPSNAVPKQWIYSSSADQKYALGAVLDLPDGRRFRYALNGGVILYKALMAQAAAVEAKWVAEVQTAKTAAVGDQDIPVLITTGSNLAAGWWDEGWYIVESGLAGAIGDMYKIKSHTVHATAVTITIEDIDGVRTALDANQVCSIRRNDHHSVVVAVTTLTGPCVGVPLVDIPIGYFGWLQTKGSCPIIVDTGETIVIGEAIGYPGTITVAGTCGLPTADTDEIWGKVMSVSAAAGAAMINLKLE